MKKLLALAALPLAFAARTQDHGTYDVSFQQLSTAGRIEGCSLVFTGLVRDSHYLRGEPVVLTGSIALRTLDRPDTLVFTGKLGTKPLSPPGAAWEAPSHLHFKTKTANSAGKGKILDGEPGYRLLLAKADADLMRFVEEMLQQGGFVVGFNRKPGGQDVLAPIQLNVSAGTDASGNSIQRRNDKTAADFADCLGRLVDSLKR